MAALLSRLKRNSSPRWFALILLWGYTLAAGVIQFSGWGSPAVAQFFEEWQSTVSQFAAMAFMLPMLRQSPPGLRRRGWWLVFAALTSDVVASFWWIYKNADAGSILPTWSNAPFLVYYPLAAAGFALFYLDLGGSFRRSQVWLDLFTLTLGLGATLWLFLLQPKLAHSDLTNLNWTVLVGYPLGDAVLMILMSLLIMQICDWRRERALLLLIAGAAFAFTTDLDWIGLNARQRHWQEIWSNVGGYSLYYALLSTAAVVERSRPAVTGNSIGAEASAYSFLPILSVLIAVAMLLGERINLGGWEGAALISFALVSATLVAARQQGVRQEIHRLHRTLAAREAETHLTELIRCSADLIVVVDASRELSFVSPACEVVLGLPADILKRRSAVCLLGEEHEARINALLTEIEDRKAGRIETEVLALTAGGERRSLLVVGSDQLATPAIAGISLTISDVTEHRRLEREVLEVAMRERERLSGELHKGLGDALAGIHRSLDRLKHAGDAAHRDAADAVAAIIGSVNNTIDTARRLALNLSPLHEVRGSLDLALGRLAKESSQKFCLDVSFEYSGDVRSIGPRDADHLYRIAQDSLDFSLKHSGCTRAGIDLSSHAGQLLLTVSDNGRAPPVGDGSERDLGARLSAYRARVMGGAIRMRRFADGWTRVEVAVPIP